MKVYVLTMTSQLGLFAISEGRTKLACVMLSEAKNLTEGKKATSRVARCWGCIAHAKKQSKPTWKQYLPNPESLPIFTTNLTWKRLMLAS